MKLPADIYFNCLKIYKIFPQCHLLRLLHRVNAIKHCISYTSYSHMNLSNDHYSNLPLLFNFISSTSGASRIYANCYLTLGLIALKKPSYCSKSPFIIHENTVLENKVDLVMHNGTQCVKKQKCTSPRLRTLSKQMCQ